MVILKSKSSTIPSYNYLPFNRSCQTKRSKERCNRRESMVEGQMWQGGTT